MAYEGEIAYMVVPLDGVEWNDRVRLSDSNELRAPLKRFLHDEGRLRSKAATSDNPRQKGEYFIYDKDEDGITAHPKWCIVMGREVEILGGGDRMYYILIVAEKSEGRFERVGIGAIQERSILFEEGKEEEAIQYINIRRCARKEFSIKGVRTVPTTQIN